MLNIILNPISNGGKVRRAFHKVHEKLVSLKTEFRVFETEREKQAIHLAHELTSEGPCDLLAVGGDGTLNEVVNGFSQFRKLPSGAYPRGYGQRFCRMRGHSARSAQSARPRSERRGKVYRLYATGRRRARHQHHRHGHRRGKFCSAAAARKYCAVNCNIFSASSFRSSNLKITAFTPNATGRSTAISRSLRASATAPRWAAGSVCVPRRK